MSNAQAWAWIIGVVVVLAIVSDWWRGRDDRELGFDDGVTYTRLYDDCVERNERGWEDHYNRPASTMSDSELMGIGYTCSGWARDQLEK